MTGNQPVTENVDDVIDLHPVARAYRAYAEACDAYRNGAPATWNWAAAVALDARTALREVIVEDLALHVRGHYDERDEA